MSNELQNITPYMHRGTGIAFGTCEKPKPKNVFWVHDENPAADYVTPWDMATAKDRDFVRFWYFFRNAKEGPMYVFRRAISLLKPGGFLLIIEEAERGEGVKQFYNYGEMEGILMLFDDHIHIDAKGVINDGKSYFYVCRKLGEDKNVIDKVSE